MIVEAKRKSRIDQIDGGDDWRLLIEGIAKKLNKLELLEGLDPNILLA